MPEGTTGTARLPNTEADNFRLRHFVEQLIDTGEIDVIDQPVELADLTKHMDGNPKAVLFRKAGKEGAEIVGNLCASRKRMAAAFDVDEADLLHEVLRRLATPQETEAVDRDAAPVQQIVWTGDEADFTRLPVPFQHDRDGGPYLSSTLDFTVNPETKRRHAAASVCRSASCWGRIPSITSRPPCGCRWTRPRFSPVCAASRLSWSKA
jgi:UbiD family decarboxylase